MKRLAMLLGCVLVGCQADAPPAEEQAAELDYAGWPTVSPKRYKVSPVYAALCMADARTDELAAADKAKHGPHAQTAIDVRVSPAGLDRFKAGQPVPAGTAVVKLKYSESHVKEPSAVGAMIKREPGYDPAGGDWEYFYDERDPQKPAVRGKIETCAECHLRAKATDFLFRTYLTVRAGGG
ncbi:MAG TPA: cytochrome P460 family protein [Gemmataceae bacterium]|jgi:hypothetical protein|nr:cytochrome P460 family protein [Gemmataceae bacterium]